MDNGAPALSHVPSVDIGIVAALGRLPIVEIDEGASAFRHKQIALLLGSRSPEIGKDAQGVDRILLLVLYLSHGNLYQKILPVQPVYHVHIIDRFFRDALLVVQLLVHEILLIRVSRPLKDLLQLRLDAVLGGIPQHICDFRLQNRVIRQKLLFVVVLSQMIDVIFLEVIPDQLLPVLIHKRSQLLQPLLTDHGRDHKFLRHIADGVFDLDIVLPRLDLIDSLLLAVSIAVVHGVHSVDRAVCHQKR